MSPEVGTRLTRGYVTSVPNPSTLRASSRGLRHDLGNDHGVVYVRVDVVKDIADRSAPTLAELATGRTLVTKYDTSDTIDPEDIGDLPDGDFNLVIRRVWAKDAPWERGQRLEVYPVRVTDVPSWWNEVNVSIVAQPSMRAVVA